MHDPAFRDIVIGFVGRLHEQLDTMRTTFDKRDYKELAALAHWLKGAGGTMGFREFTEPAAQLERSAKGMQEETIPSLLAELQEMANAIETPSNSPTQPFAQPAMV
jgi:HPt (histidine-containing phosphotransfer) domain-containing protein